MVRTGRGSTVKERGGATHYSYGEGSLTIHMVRVRKHTRLSRRGCVSTLTIHMVRVRKHTRLSRRGCVSTLTIHMVRGHSLIPMGEGLD